MCVLRGGPAIHVTRKITRQRGADRHSVLSGVPSTAAMNPGESHVLAILKGGIGSLLGGLGTLAISGGLGYLGSQVWHDWPTAIKVLSVVVLLVAIGGAILLVALKILGRGPGLFLAGALVACILVGLLFGLALAHTNSSAYGLSLKQSTV